MTVRLQWTYAEIPDQGEGLLSPSHRQLTSKPLGVPLGHPRWMFSHLDPHAAEAYQGGTIHFERLNSSLADGSEVENNCGVGIPGKVLFP